MEQQNLDKGIFLIRSEKEKTVFVGFSSNLSTWTTEKTNPIAFVLGLTDPVFEVYCYCDTNDITACLHATIHFWKEKGYLVYKNAMQTAVKTPGKLKFCEN